MKQMLKSSLKSALKGASKARRAGGNDLGLVNAKWTKKLKAKLLEWGWRREIYKIS